MKLCSKASSKLWAMWRLMELGLEYEVILDCYYKEVRSILEYGAVIFHSGLSKKLSRQIEAIQKQFLRGLASYLKVELFSYDELMIFFHTESLESRREDISRTFINRNLKNPRFNFLFRKRINVHNTRPNAHKFEEDNARTTAFYNSPLVYLRRLSNKE